MKRILITGDNSYIGTSFENYLKQWPNQYQVDILDTRDLNPLPEMFTGYDSIFHVAGIAHIKETKDNQNLFYKVNRDLTIEIAKAVQRAHVKQFIILSSMSVYGMNTGVITKETEPAPTTAYGRSKYEADSFLLKEANNNFQVAVLRPPLVYGKGCKGNYQQLRSFALKYPVFPNYKNRRSMIYIGNLCEFVKQIVDEMRSGVFFPQNAEYVCTSNMVKEISIANNKSCVLLKNFNPFIRILPLIVFDKVFGTLIYEEIDTVDKFSFIESIRLCEKSDSL